MVQTEEMWKAYRKCLKNKRNTPDGVNFVLDRPMYEIAKIVKQINTRTYEPYSSKCFVITRPRYREAFAAQFRDRIVQDWVMMRLEPLFEEVYSDRTFNCRKEKGQLYGTDLLRGDIKHVSGDYKEDAWILKLDLAGYFMSIDKEGLAADVTAFARERYDGDDLEDLCYVTDIIIRNNPQDNCVRLSAAELWGHIPPNKSLFTVPRGKGVPIGNLTSQHTGNFRLYLLDHLLDTLAERHGRYVDDIYMVDKDPERLKRAIPVIRDFLAGYGLKLNEKKTRLQPWRHGVEFTGARIKGRLALPSENVTRSFMDAVTILSRQTTLSGVRKCVPGVNSYLGTMTRFCTYKMRRRWLKKLPDEVLRFVRIREDYGAVCLKKEFSPRLKKIERWRAAS